MRRRGVGDPLPQLGWRRTSAKRGLIAVSWNLQRLGRGQWGTILEQLELEETWDLVLCQEALAPGLEEQQQFDFGDSGVSSSAIRGHIVFMAPSGIAVVVHRKWSAVIQAVLAGDCFVGVVLSAGHDSRGVAAASIHLPSSWCGDSAAQGSLAQLDLLFEQAQAPGAPQPRILLGGDWNAVLNATSSGRSEVVEAWAASHGVRPRAPSEWAL